MTALDRQTLAAEEVKFVAKEYALRRPIHLEEIRRGSRSVAKGRLRGVDGDWMVKRRPHARAARLDVVHAFQLHLRQAGVPVAALRRNLQGSTRTDGDRGVYELFDWVAGTRWSQVAGEAAEVGAAVGTMLRAGAGFRPPSPPLDASSHRSPSLRVDPAGLASVVLAAEPASDRALVDATCRSLLERARRMEDALDSAGAAALPACFVHGDIHPGNVIFAAGRVGALLDFDTARIDLRMREAASALNAFGSEPRTPEPPDRWAPGQDLGRMSAIVAGLQQGMGAPISSRERRVLPWLMIEACARESLERILRTGRFDQHPASLFLVYVDRKTAWIEENADEISGL